MSLSGLPQELRLFYAMLLNAAVLWAGWRYARRWSADAVDAASDAGLLFYLVQYVSVCAPGVVGALHPITIGLVAILVSAGLVAAGRRKREEDPPIAIGGLSRVTLLASVLFVLGYLAALAWTYGPFPVTTYDAITYHLPAAVQWLQTGKLGMYEAWFYNPANSYSPLGGSVFIAWLLAPFGNDIIARFVEMGPLILLFLGMMNLCRGLGAKTGVAAVLAAACVLARPFVSQVILSKDDLFAAGFFVLLIDAMRREKLEQRMGPWRVGVALGLLLATKYTVLLSLPIGLLMLGRGWTWRRGLIALGCAAVLAGPWYVRNLALTGSPLYPMEVKVFDKTILPGMLRVGRSLLLATPRGAWKIFTVGYYAIPPIVAVVLLVGWIAAWARGGGDFFRERLTRTVLVGPVIGIAIFVFSAPYAEMRFAYPSIALLFAALAVALRNVPETAAAIVGAGLVLVSALTAFVSEIAAILTLTGAVAAGAGALIAGAREKGLRLPKRAVAGLAIAGAFGLFVWIYVRWAAFVEGYEQTSVAAWSDRSGYGPIAEAWEFVRGKEPTTIAYANTYFTYPLMGFDFRHRILYVPTRRGLSSFVGMPRIETPMTGEQITGYIIAMLREDSDREQWLSGLKASGATYLFVGKYDPAVPKKKVMPPELVFTERDPGTFEVIFDNDAARVFKIEWK